MKAFTDKGRLSNLLVQTPVRLILESRAALMGAAAYAEARAAEISGHSERAHSVQMVTSSSGFGRSPWPDKDREAWVFHGRKPPKASLGSVYTNCETAVAGNARRDGVSCRIFPVH